MISKSTTELADLILAQVNLKQEIKRISYCRLAAFLGVAMVLFILWLFQDFLLPGIFLVGIDLAFFVWLVTKHRHIKAQLLYTRARIALVKMESEIKKGHPSPWDDGSTWSSDDRIFGQHKIFHKINRTVTSAGKKTLADLLCLQDELWLNWRKRRDAIQELSSQPVFIQLFQSANFIYQHQSGDSQALLNLHKKQTIQATAQTYKYLVRLILESDFKHAYLVSLKDQVAQYQNDLTRLVIPIALFDAMQSLAWYANSQESPVWAEKEILIADRKENIESLYRNPYGYTVFDIKVVEQPTVEQLTQEQKVIMAAGGTF